MRLVVPPVVGWKMFEGERTEPTGMPLPNEALLSTPFGRRGTVRGAAKLMGLSGYFCSATNPMRCFRSWFFGCMGA